MTDKTPDSKPETPAPGTASPETTGTGFARRQVQWGRPPSQVFHAGPLPRGPLAPLPPIPRTAPNAPDRSADSFSAAGPSGSATTVAPVTTRPSPLPLVQSAPPARAGAPTGGGFYNNSMIPKARAAASAASVITPAPERPVEPVEVTVPSPAWPDTTVRPLPAAPVASASAPAARSLDAVSAEDPQPAPTPTPAVAMRPEASLDVEPTVPAYARVARKTGASRLPLYIGAGVVLIAAIGAGAWLLRPKPVAPPAAVEVVAPGSTSTPVQTAPTPVVAPEPVETPPVSTAAEAPVVTSAPAQAAPVRPTPVRPTTTRPTTVESPTPTRPATRPTAQTNPAPVRTAPVATRPAPTTAPQITVAPIIAPPVSQPASPPPTAARSQSADPNAPISTRPQPLD